MYLLGRWDFLRTEWYIAIGHDIVDHSLAYFCTYPPFCKWTRQQNVPKMQLSFKVVNSIAVHEKKAGLIPTNMVDALDNICRKLDIRVLNTTKNLSCKKSKFLQTSYARIYMMLFLIFKRILKYSNTQLIALHPNAYKYFASLKSKDITLALLPHFKWYNKPNTHASYITEIHSF